MNLQWLITKVILNAALRLPEARRRQLAFQLEQSVGWHPCVIISEQEVRNEIELARDDDPDLPEITDEDLLDGCWGASEARGLMQSIRGDRHERD